MTAIFHRKFGAPPPMAVRGDGVYLFDSHGRRYLDASGGAAVSCLGHGHKRVIDAIKAQLDHLAYAHTSFFTSEPAEALAELLIAKAPSGFGKVYFVSGGSEAVETSLKLARAYHIARGEPQRRLMISRRQSYHGNTLGALSVSGNPGRRAPYEPLLINQPRIAPCYAYREKGPSETAATYALRCANDLESAIIEAGPQHVAAFIAETVVGATLGACPAEAGYFKRIREICNAYGILYIADEVMCGMGRTGRTFAVEWEDVAPDIITVAKGLAGGYQPIGAVLAALPVHEALAATGFEHGHTYIGHAAACAGALAVQQIIDEEALLAAVRARGDKLRSLLSARLDDTGIVGEIRGRGLLTGVEFVANCATRAPLHPEQKFAARLKDAAMSRGLICYPGAGCIDGVRGDHVLLAPPFIISDDELETLADLLAASINDVLSMTASA